MEKGGEDTTNSYYESSLSLLSPINSCNSFGVYSYFSLSFSKAMSPLFRTTVNIGFILLLYIEITAGVCICLWKVDGFVYHVFQ